MIGCMCAIDSHPSSRRRRARSRQYACNTFWELRNTVYLCRKVGIAIMDGPTRWSAGSEGDTIKTIAPRSLAPSRQEEGSNTCSTCVAAASTYRDGRKGEPRLRCRRRHPGGGVHKTWGPVRRGHSFLAPCNKTEPTNFEGEWGR